MIGEGIGYNKYVGETLQDWCINNEKLIWHIVNRYKKAWSDSGSPMTKDDVFQIASMGVMKAYEKYDPSKYEGVNKFSTYAVPMMVGEIQRELRDHREMVRVSRSTKSLALFIISRNLVEKPPEEIYELLIKEGMSVYDNVTVTTKSIMSAINFCYNKDYASLEKPLASNKNGEKVTMGDTIGKSDNYSHLFLEEFTSSLDSRLKTIVSMIIDGYTQQEIGNSIGVSQVQISRLITKIRQKYLEYSEQSDTPIDPNDYVKSKKKLKRNEETTVRKKISTESKNQAIELLQTTDLTYSEISSKTGVPNSTVGVLGRQYRTPEKRKYIQYKTSRQRSAESYKNKVGTQEEEELLPVEELDSRVEVPERTITADTSSTDNTEDTEKEWMTQLQLGTGQRSLVSSNNEGITVSCKPTSSTEIGITVIIPDTLPDELRGKVADQFIHISDVVRNSMGSISLKYDIKKE